MRFDGYGASIQPEKTSLLHVTSCLADTLSTHPAPGPAVKRWGQTTAFHSNGRMAAWLGFDHSTGAMYIEAKGDTTPGVVAALRRDFQHSAPRLDVCEDYDEEKAFERLQGLIRTHKGPRVKGGYVALPDDDQDGRTWAAGKRGGVAYLRLYDSGKHPDRVHLCRPNLVRAEIEARPHYAKDKLAAASMAPLEVWGLTAWTQRVGQALTQCDIPRLEAEARKYSFDKTTRYLANTFRRHLEEMRDNGEDFMRTCEAIWEDEDATRTRH